MKFIDAIFKDFASLTSVRGQHRASHMGVM